MKRDRLVVLGQLSGICDAIIALRHEMVRLGLSGDFSLGMSKRDLCSLSSLSGVGVPGIGEYRHAYDTIAGARLMVAPIDNQGTFAQPAYTEVDRSTF